MGLISMGRDAIALVGVSCVAVLGLVGCGSTGGSDAAGAVSPAPVSTATASVDANRSGWRWESYRDVELQVPASWVDSAESTSWCSDPSAKTPATVGRPGPESTIECGPMPVRLRSPYAWFDVRSSPGITALGGGWVREVRAVGDQRIEAVDNDAKRRALVLASARTIDAADTNGCAVSSPVSGTWRPTGASLTGLRPAPAGATVSMCRYGVRPAAAHDELLASRRLTSTAAVDLLTSASSAASSPTSANHDQCEDVHGAETVVLSFDDGAGSTGTALLRYDGCEDLGLADSAGVRPLTAPVLRSVLTGALAPSTTSELAGELLDAS